MLESPRANGHSALKLPGDVQYGLIPVREVGVTGDWLWRGQQESGQLGLGAHGKGSGSY